MALVIDAMEKMASIFTGVPDAASRVPKAPW
jgi:hypothetical protein